MSTVTTDKREKVEEILLDIADDNTVDPRSRLNAVKMYCDFVFSTNFNGGVTNGD